MKKYLNRVINIFIVVMVLLVGAMIYFKFIDNKQTTNSTFSIDNINNLSITDTNGETLKLVDVLIPEKVNFMLILEIDNCQSCILKSINDLQVLKKAGQPCIVVTVHDYPKEVAGWSATHDFTPFFTMKKADFYQHISSEILPVIVKIKDKKVIAFRYISI